MYGTSAVQRRVIEWNFKSLLQQDFDHLLSIVESSSFVPLALACAAHQSLIRTATICASKDDYLSIMAMVRLTKGSFSLARSMLVLQSGAVTSSALRINNKVYNDHALTKIADIEGRYDSRPALSE